MSFAVSVVDPFSRPERTPWSEDFDQVILVRYDHGVHQAVVVRRPRNFIRPMEENFAAPILRHLFFPF
jgi:hypothetical protein